MGSTGGRELGEVGGRIANGISRLTWRDLLFLFLNKCGGRVRTKLMLYIVETK
uniref:Uncharacterized protein n=1 Tax=Setaria italica TaxID=4555 RepID=K3ZPT9_SETIT